eukprot:GDKJ01015904.1.p1 GENE.GDKJ01015904.1~~GDKJ01015904.1.p1  ORF type:complete len:248 (+),score=31.68 GDKJ01015904.1:85-744(+)
MNYQYSLTGLNREVADGFKNFTIVDFDQEQLILSVLVPVVSQGVGSVNLIIECRIPAFYPLHSPDFVIKNIEVLCFPSYAHYKTMKGDLCVSSGFVRIPMMENWNPLTSIQDCLTKIQSFISSIIPDVTSCRRSLQSQLVSKDEFFFGSKRPCADADVDADSSEKEPTSPFVLLDHAELPNSSSVPINQNLQNIYDEIIAEPTPVHTPHKQLFVGFPRR